jgi:methionyl-tRNA formyltransferase
VTAKEPTVRVAFLGNDPWSVEPLRALADAADVEVELVVTNPPRPAGRGSRLTPTAVADMAGELDLPLLEVARIRDGAGFDALDALQPDALVVVAYGEILTPDVLDIPRLGGVNVHFSLLPRWRGAAPVQHAILAGDEVTGVTVMRMDEGMDTGPILAARETPIDPDEDAGTLGGRLSVLGAPLLVDSLRGLDAGTIEPRSQEDAAATFAPKPTPDARVIDWSQDADAIVRRVRAFGPDPGATTTFRGEPLKVLRAEAQPIADALTVGTERGRLGRSEGDGVPFVDVVGTVVRLAEVAPAGRRRMTGAVWARGARLRPGERIG